jgi:hypothetical protein
MAEFIKPWLKADGFVVGAQNGMNDDAIASIVGRNRVVGCVVIPFGRETTVFARASLDR